MFLYALQLIKEGLCPASGRLAEVLSQTAEAGDPRAIEWCNQHGSASRPAALRGFAFHDAALSPNLAASKPLDSTAAVITATALAFTGCSGLAPGENAAVSAEARSGTGIAHARA